MQCRTTRHKLAEEDEMADGAYGLWPLVILNTALFVVFAMSFFHPRSRRDWRAMGAYTAFLVALFTEMYGAPLTVYLLSGWLGSRFPLIRPDHAGGHLWNDLIGWNADPHLSPFHLASYLFIGGGFWLIAAAWNVLHASAQRDELAITGPYAKVRHPQYDGFVLIMIGFLLQWPTIPTLVMFPVLLLIYTRLAKAEEREVRTRFGDTWAVYAASTPAFLPHRAANWPPGHASPVPPPRPPEPAHGGQKKQPHDRSRS
jgi:protein-S-isoprenylcysteine O-methyltransferase Ste14